MRSSPARGPCRHRRHRVARGPGGDAGRPRKVLLMVKAGAPVDALIEALVPLLDDGDIIIDGATRSTPTPSDAPPPSRRSGLRYVGAGVSGGEEGARHGPSIMPAGVDGWPEVRPCCRRSRPGRRKSCLLRLGRPRRGGPLREDGPQRHRVRRHAADRRGVPPAPVAASGSPHPDMAAIFREWNDGVLDSLPGGDHRRHSRGHRRGRAPRSSASSTPPARRAPASGP